MKSSIDYSWMIFLGIAVVIAIFWKPLYGTFTGVSNKAHNTEGIARGKVVFYDTTRWAGKDSYMSCAMCHDPNFKPEAGKPPIKMIDYHPGKPVVIHDVSKDFGNVMSGDDELFAQINKCLALQSRMNVGKVSTQAPFAKDLLAYIKSL